jgi:hypothetical protein
LAILFGILVAYFILSIPIKLLFKRIDKISDKFIMAVGIPAGVIICGPLTVSLGIFWLKYDHFGPFLGISYVLFLGVFSAIIPLYGMASATK